MSAELMALSSTAQSRLQIKLRILRLCEHFRAAHDYSQQVGRVLFCRAWNAGELAVDDELARAWPTLSPKSLANWHYKRQRKGDAALAGEYGKTKGRNLIDTQPELRDCVLAALTEFPQMKALRVWELLAARYQHSPEMVLPCVRSLTRWIADWKAANAQTWLALTNPDQWKNKYMVAMGDASGDVTRINQRWEVDCTPADLLLADGRYVLSCGIDVYTRRKRILVTKSARTAANMQLVRRMIMDFGVPEMIKSDQGVDYNNKRYTLTLDKLGIEHRLSQKFSPWTKAHIERAQQTFLHDLIELLPGYCGHNVFDAQALRAQKSFAEQLYTKNATVAMHLTADELQAFCDEWCLHRYEHRPHSELGMTPFAKAASWREPIRRIDDERALDMLLAEVPTNNGIRIVQKKGIQLPEGWFIAPELEAHIGTQVQVFYLPDAGTVVVYRTEDYAFVCIAENPELTGISRVDIAAKAKQMQRERVQAERAALRAVAKRVNVKEAAAEILRADRERSTNLVAFPKRAEAHSTDALQSAADAVAALNPAPRDTSDLIDAETFRRLRDKQATEDAILTPRFESKAARAFWIADQHFSRALTAEEHLFLNEYRRDFPRDAQEMDELMQLRHGSDAAEM